MQSSKQSNNDVPYVPDLVNIQSGSNRRRRNQVVKTERWIKANIDDKRLYRVSKEKDSLRRETALRTVSVVPASRDLRLHQASAKNRAIKEVSTSSMVDGTETWAEK